MQVRLLLLIIYPIKKTFRVINSAFSSAVIFIYFIKDFSVVWLVIRIMDIKGMPP